MYDNFKSTKNLLLLIAVFLIGFILFTVIGYRTIANIKINGEMYNNIMRSKELVADVLPPPGYIIESYLVTLQLQNETDKIRIEELINTEYQLKREYLNCHEKWEKNLPDGDLKKNMAERAYKPAMAYFDLFETQVVPAIRNGDHEKVEMVVKNQLEPLYLEHRYYIDEVVAIANEENLALESSANEMVYLNILVLVILAIVVLATIIIFCAAIIRNEKLKKMSLLDELTSVANRRYFDQMLIQEINRAIREKTPLSLMIIDIDYYKEYNDTYCLKQVVTALKKNLKRSGDFLARYGGDEFVVILPNTNDIGSVYLGEKLRASIEALGIEHKRSPCSQYVTLSIGVATTFAKEILLPENFFATADSALYHSKEAGRNRVTVELLH